MSKEDVTHRGVIERVERHKLVVRTEEPCKCDGCAITALCSGKEGNGKELLTIDTPQAENFSAGDKIEITATSGSTLRATWWALALPTIIFGGTILGCRFGFPDIGGWSIAIGFGALAVYDLFLYSYRKRLAQRISWKVVKI